MEVNENMPRRKFLALASAASLGGAALFAGNARAATAVNDLGKTTHAMFTPHVGTMFQIQTAPGMSVSVQLVQATALPGSTRKKAKRTTFSLLFRGPASPVLGQDVYDLGHTQLGAFKGVFLAYVGPDKGKKNSYYEAIFS